MTTKIHPGFGVERLAAGRCMAASCNDSSVGLLGKGENRRMQLWQLSQSLSSQ